MRKLLIAATSILLAVSLGSSPASAKQAHAETIRVKVVSQNVYIGANIFRLVEGEDPNAVLETVQQTNFPERSDQIAKQIRRTKPDLIGLQEVADISVFNSAGAELLSLDYLEILLESLKEKGLDYKVGAVVNNLDGTLPIGPDQFARVVDRDVILYRTKTTSITNPISKNYTTKAQLPIAGTQLDYLRGYASVDATVRGEKLRFVNTHLETQRAQCQTSTGAIACQEAQARELADTLSTVTLPVILVGDLNAEVGEPTYQILDDAGFDNTRKNHGRSPGYTCCNVETLDNENRELDQRIDHILVRAPGAKRIRASNKVLGDSQNNRTPSGLWPSDHAAPFSKIRIVYR